MPPTLRICLTTLLLHLAAASTALAQPQLELMPAIGVGKATGEGSDSVDVGPGFLVSIGARLHPMASLHGQINVDRPGIDSEIPGVDASLWMFRGQIVPAFHLGNEKLDFGLGPAFGLFLMRASIEGSTPFGNIDATATVRGFTLGLQTWLMARVSPEVSLGPVFSYGRLWATKVCSKEGAAEECDDDPENDDEGYWNLAVGVLF